MIELRVLRSVPNYDPTAAPENDAYEAFRAALVTAVGAEINPCWTLRKGDLYILLNDGATSEQQNAALQVGLTHDFTQRTAAQTARAARRANIAAIRNEADTLAGEITSDLAILQGTPTNAQILQAVIRLCQRQRKLVRGLEMVAVDVVN